MKHKCWLRCTRRQKFVVEQKELLRYQRAGFNGFVGRIVQTICSLVLMDKILHVSCSYHNLPNFLMNQTRLRFEFF